MSFEYDDEDMEIGEIIFCDAIDDERPVDESAIVDAEGNLDLDVDVTMANVLEGVDESFAPENRLDDDEYASDVLSEEQEDGALVTMLQQGAERDAAQEPTSVMSSNIIDEGSAVLCVSSTGIKKWGYNSVTGSGTFDWKPISVKYQDDQHYYQDMNTKRNSVLVEYAWTNNFNLSLSTWVSSTSAAQAARSLNHVEVLTMSIAVAVPEQRFTVRFVDPIVVNNLNVDYLTNYVKNGNLDHRSICSDLQMRMQFGRSLAQSLAPMMMSGLLQCDVTSFYTMGFLFLAHRLWYTVAAQMPRYVDVINDSVERVNINDVAANLPGIITRIGGAIDNGSLVLLARDYTPIEIDALHLLCNGLPVFRHALEARNRCILDNFYSPKINCVLIYEDAPPAYGVEIISPSVIRTLMRKIAIQRNEYNFALSGFMRASVYAMFHNGAGGVGSLVNGFLEYKYADWAVPRFQNPMLHWLNILVSNNSDNTMLEFRLAVSGTAVEVLSRMADLNCLTSVCFSTLFLRWNIHSGLLNDLPNVEDVLEGGSFKTFFIQQIYKSGSNAPVFRAVAHLFKSLLGHTMMSEMLAMPRWCAGFSRFNAVIPAAEGWSGGWARRIPFATAVYAVMWQIREWPSIWGFLKSPVTITLNREFTSDTSITLASFYPILGDDALREFDLMTGAVPMTPYSILLLNSCLQHAKVQVLANPVWRWTGTKISDMLPVEEGGVLPNLDYNARLRVINPGSYWIYDWSSNKILVASWRLDRLNDRFRTLVLNNEKQYLVSGIISGVVGDIMLASGKRHWSAAIDDLSEL